MNKDALRLGLIALVLLGALFAATSYYRKGEQAKESARVLETLRSDDAAFVRDHSPALGPENAPVQVVEFLDPECESCRLMHPVVKGLLKRYEGRVRYVVRYMPLHGNSVYAAGALEAARAQGRYWEMMDLLFERQPQWGSHHAPHPELIPGYARELGLDMAAFEQFIQRGSYRTQVLIDRNDGQALGVTGTPTFFVNGQRLQQLGERGLQAMIEEGLR